jgi:hypothetical protein
VIIEIAVSLNGVKLALPNGSKLDVDVDLLEKISMIIGYDLVQQHDNLHAKHVASLMLSVVRQRSSNLKLELVGKLHRDVVYRCNGESTLVRISGNLQNCLPVGVEEFYLSKHE